MSSPYLTIILILDCEKDPAFLKRFFWSLRELNADGLADIQLIIISQQALARDALSLSASQPFPVDVIHARHEFVDGYPVWDVCEEVRAVWPLVRGQYITFAHAEYFCGPGRLRATADWLRANRPWVALGNLRRFGTQADSLDWRTHRGTKCHSDALAEAVDANLPDQASRILAERPSVHWCYWRPEPEAGPGAWQEDVFFADVELMNAIRFFSHGGRLPFQDVYDLMGMMFAQLSKHGLSVPCMRMPRDVHEAVHLWHPKHWQSWTPSMRDWFLSNPREWEGTRFLDAELWQRLLAESEAKWIVTESPVVDIRNGPGGTVTRFAVAMSQWLREGGKDVVNEFLTLHGKDRHAV